METPQPQRRVLWWIIIAIIIVVLIVAGLHLLTSLDLSKLHGG